MFVSLMTSTSHSNLEDMTTTSLHQCFQINTSHEAFGNIPNQIFLSVSLQSIESSTASESASNHHNNTHSYCRYRTHNSDFHNSNIHHMYEKTYPHSCQMHSKSDTHNTSSMSLMTHSNNLHHTFPTDTSTLPSRLEKEISTALLEYSLVLLSASNLVQTSVTSCEPLDEMSAVY